MNSAEKPRGIGEEQTGQKTGAVSTREGQSEAMSTYLGGPKFDFGIHRIYYPGCGQHPILEDAFTTDEIAYMDNDSGNFIVYPGRSFCRKSRHFVLGDHQAIPFRDGVFDAIYYNDCHANYQQFLAMLRTLRIGGIVIRDGLVCVNEISVEETANVHGLVEVNYRLQIEIDGRPTHVFKKIHETPDPKLEHPIPFEIRVHVA